VDEATALLNNWCSGLAKGASQDNRVPRDSLGVTPGQNQSIPGESCLRASNELVWTRPVEGTLCLMGLRDIVLGDNFIPLASDTWIEALEAATVTSKTTASVISEGGVLAALRAFHGMLLEAFARNSRRAEDGFQQQIDRQAVADRERLRAGLTDLAFVSRPDKSQAVPDIVPGEALLSACIMVGSALGIDVRSPSREQGHQLDVADIARASRIRTRQVVMKGDWWQSDNGPLLAFRIEDGGPVALLPVTTNHYELLDPVDGSRRRVDADVAKTLEPRGNTFFRPFPDRALNGKDLLAFGLQGCRSDLIMVFVMGLVAATLGLLTPLATGIIFDTIIPGSDRGQLVQILLILVVAAIAMTMFGVTKSIALLRLEVRMGAAVQAAVWDRLLALPAKFFRDYNAGDLAQRSLGIDQIRSILSGVVVSTILGGMFSSMSLIMMFYYASPLAWIAIGLTAVGMLFAGLTIYLQLKHLRKVIDLEGAISGMTLQFITGVSKLRITGAEDRAFAIWAKIFAKKWSYSFKAGVTGNVLGVFNAVFPIVSTMAVFSYLILNEALQLTTGSFLGFMSAFVGFQGGMLQMTSTLAGSLNVVQLYNRSRPILEALPEVDESKVSPGELRGRLDVDQVSFRYQDDGPQTIKQVNLHAAPGEFIAIVGSSGSGKSTLLRLLLGFETPDSGALYCDGLDMASIDTREVRRQTGVVLQDAMLMQGDILSNIIGSANLTLEDAWKAAEMVGIREEIEQMPMKMSTLVPIGGGTLSGGQCQRLIIARAIVKQPRILLLDEATSALDNRTQSVISESLEGLNVTRIVVAHRLSTIKHADRIYVLDAGEIVEVGAYDELMQQDGVFAALAKRQIA
ncbi:NHLP bacteriocin export ABC transporter permease/ATPase subunit, partial [Congregibacter sp.]|uniref:NHLP bacteriocin export ABC transporter permease/ATPase subunit n=1 Tax=Congregibacter sp. TaxID=2744308 RepID=UPI0039E33015